MPASGPVLERITACCWPRGGLQARRVRGSHPLTSTHTGEPVARRRPMPSGACFEVLWWRREAWEPAGPFGAALPPNNALRLIASQPASWIRA